MYDFYIDFNLKIDKYKIRDEIRIMNKFKPNFIFTGTSYTSKIELKFIKEAKIRKIKSFSFIDHYTRFNERFEFNNEYFLPDTIFVSDKFAKKIAQSSNVLEHLPIKVIGNYYHSYLKKWKPQIKKNIFFQNLNISSKTKIVLFAPDPLSNLTNNFFEFDENEVLKAIFLSLKILNNSNILLIIKAHPNQNIKYLSDVIKNFSNENIFLTKSMDVKYLNYYSDIIIGMYSSLLIEASFFDKKIIRHLPIQTHDPFKNLNIGIITSTHNQLAEAIKKFL